MKFSCFFRFIFAISPRSPPDNMNRETYYGFSINFFSNNFAFGFVFVYSMRPIVAHKTKQCARDSRMAKKTKANIHTVLILHCWHHSKCTHKHTHAPIQHTNSEYARSGNSLSNLNSTNDSRKINTQNTLG